MTFATTIMEIGPEADSFLDQNMMITFSGEAPDELRPFCFLLKGGELTGSLGVGQEVAIGDEVRVITAVGTLATKNLRDFGHVTLVFDGAEEPQMPGAVHVDPPTLNSVEPGTKVVFFCE